MFFFNKTESFVGRNTSNHACQIFSSKRNCETMYHWFFILEIAVVKIMNTLNVCSAHSYLYPRSQFKKFVNSRRLSSFTYIKVIRQFWCFTEILLPIETTWWAINIICRETIGCLRIDNPDNRMCIYEIRLFGPDL